MYMVQLVDFAPRTEVTECRTNLFVWSEMVALGKVPVGYLHLTEGPAMDTSMLKSLNPK